MSNLAKRLFSAAFLFGASATLLAQSNISFEYSVNRNDQSAATTIAQGDFNNDGKPDLLVAGSSLTLQLGNGDGTFQPSKIVGTLSQTSGDLAVADLNGDGKLDAISSNYDGTVQIFLGNGDGSFQRPETLPNVYSAHTITTGYFTGGPFPDIAVGDDNGEVELFRNIGGGSFTLANTINVAGAGNILQLIRSGDFDGNGTTDLAIITDFTAYVAWGDGKGGLKPVKLASYPLSSVSQIQMNVGDLNQDGRSDILIDYSLCTSGPYCMAIDAFYGEPNQTTNRSRIITDNTGDFPFGVPNSIWAADANGDGIADVVLWGASGYRVQTGLLVWLGHADGTFDQAPQTFVAASDGGTSIVPGDWNRDGMIDFAAPSVDGGFTQEVFLNSTLRAPCAFSAIGRTVTVCQPVDNTYTPSPVTIHANAVDMTPITALQEYVDYNHVYSTHQNTFDISLPEPLGPHLLVTKAWDASGASFRSDRNITVYSGTPGVTCAAAPNSAHICLPAGDTVSSPVRILANGYSQRVGYAFVSIIPTAAQLYIDGKLVVNNTNLSSFVDTTQSLSRGSHLLVFKLWNAAGDVYTTSKTIAVE